MQIFPEGTLQFQVPIVFMVKTFSVYVFHIHFEFWIMYCKTSYPKHKSLTTYVPWKAQFGQKIGKPQVVGSKYASIWSFTPNAVVEWIYSTCLYALDLQAICNCFLWAFFFRHSAPEYRNIHKILYGASAFEVSRHIYYLTEGPCLMRLLVLRKIRISQNSH